MRCAILPLLCATACGAASPDAGSTDTGAATSSSDATTEATTEACPISELSQCDAPDLCGTIEVADRPDPMSYAEAELCAFAALRDRTPGRLHYQNCAGSGCEGVDILMLADGQAFGDFASFDAETGSSMYGQPIPCELPPATVFEACLAAFDGGCTWMAFTTDCQAAAPICTCP